MKLTFIGGPGQFVAGVPAQDIEVEDEDRAAELIAGGLYEKAPATAPPQTTEQNENQAATEDSED